MDRWLTSTVLMAVVLTGAMAGANVWIDIYGLYRAHATRPAYGDERIAKYLLSTRYVQDHFHGVLIGSSISANWPVGTIGFYNESLNGGNIVEEKAILERVLTHGRITQALLVVHPYLTAFHEFNAVTLEPRLARSALGSQTLLDAYKMVVKVRLAGGRPLIDGAGTAHFEDTIRPLNAHLQELMKAGSDFAVDGIALVAYRDVVAMLHARGIPISFVIPPVSDAMRARKPDAFTRYASEMLSDRRPLDTVLDFTTDELGHHANNFTDGVHLTTAAAVTLVGKIRDLRR